MDFRLIPPVSGLDKFDGQIVFKIPVLLKKVFLEKAKGQTVPVLFERLDFKSGNMITTPGITFKKSLSLFEDLGKILPFETSAMVYNASGRIAFKIIGVYNQGIWEELHDVENIMNNDENSIQEKFHHHYKALNDWVGNIDDAFYDKPL